MINQLNHTKTWGEFVEWVNRSDSYRFYSDGTIRNIISDAPVNERELLSLLVEFCDSKGYYIELEFNSPDPDSDETKTEIDKGFEYKISHQDKDGYWDKDIYWKGVTNKGIEFFTRTEATEAGIKRALELLEEK